MDHFIVFLIATNPDIILATIDRNFPTFAVREIPVSIPKNLISAMSAFVVGSVVIFGGDFLWHKVIFDLSQEATPKAGQSAPSVRLFSPLAFHPT